MKRICEKLFACLCVTAGSFLLLALSGCVAPMKLPSRIRGPVGGTLQKDAIDLTFLQAGTTRREEVVDKLKLIDTGYSSSLVFWGRWSESKLGVVVIGLGGDASRVWYVHNLLVNFDEDGVMQSQELIGSEKALERELRAQLAKAPPLDLSQPEKIWVMNTYYGELEMNLTKDGIGMLVSNREKPSKSLDVEISPLKIGRIRYMDLGPESSSGGICHMLHLTEKTPIGKSLIFCTSAGNLATIFKYFQQVGQPNMRWE
jgi:hypothetical protein